MLATVEMVFVLLIAFEIKHFIGDFPLQREYMLRKTIPGWGFFIPLSVHCGVHAGLTMGILLSVAPKLWWLGVVDFVVHFLMDRIKSGPKYLGRFNDKDKSPYWNAFGFDQMIHHLTNFYIVYEIAKVL